MTNEPSGADERARLLVYLAGRNVGCPACEYNLRDLRTDICPECGAHLNLGMILGTDPGFGVRRMRVIWACAAVLLVGAGLALVAATLARRRASLLGVLPVGAFGSLVGSAVVLGWDGAVHADRMRYPRARNIASFAPVVHLWTGVLVAEVVLDIVVIATALI